MSFRILEMKPIHFAEYHIGIICALKLEQAAVLAMLDEEFGIVDEKDPGDYNTYFTGRIHQHHVVIACLPAGIDGTVPAANVATNMFRTFRQIRYGLLVGIGGGIPDQDSGIDIRLGDVVVGQPHDDCPGVVQHDKGKHEMGNSWRSKSILNAPPVTLLTALHTLQAIHVRQDSKMAVYMANMLEQNPKMRAEYSNPGADEDVLYASADALKAREGANPHGDVTPVVRKERLAIEPQIHYGIIASGNSVIKDSVKRDQLRRKYGAICVEMEAAGLMNTFPCLVIRGICDYADRHKNDNWHGYAAAAAAAFAKELLSYVSKPATSQEERASVLLGDLMCHFEQQKQHNQQLSVFAQRQEASQQHEKYQRCHQIFNTSDYEDQKNRNPDPAQGTCRWVLEDPMYRDWCQKPENNLLWISADPGCGKSVLSKYLVDFFIRNTDTLNAKSNKSHTICYFFFKEAETQDSLVTALSALLHQLFTQQPELIHHAISAFGRMGDKLPYRRDELWRIFKSAICDPQARPVICFLDALDECKQEDMQKLMDYICHLSSDTPRQVKWLVTSRPYDTIQRQFQQVPPAFQYIRLRGEDKNDEIQKEINLVIDEKVNKIARDALLPEKKIEEITRQLRAMSNRTYLWLHLIMNEIETIFYTSFRPATESIPELPASVEAAYSKILDRINTSVQRQRVKAILTILVGARRALTLGEMALALDVADYQTPPRLLSDLTTNADVLESKIRGLCGLFVFINHKRLYLIHQTAKEFLLYHSNELAFNTVGWKHCLRSLDVDHTMARICVLFLCLEDLVPHLNYGDGKGSAVSEISTETKPLSSVQSFFNFAAEHWAEYVRFSEATLDRATQLKMETLYNTKSKQFPYWTSAMWRTTSRNYLKFDMNNIRLAAFNGHALFLQCLLRDSKDDLDAQDIGAFTALIWTAVFGHSDAASVLLDFGADINGPGGDTYYSNALLAASMYGHLSMVKLLLDRGANINARRTRYSDTALHAASRLGHRDVVELLLSKNADIIAHSLHGTPLQAAAANGHQAIVELLLQHGADANEQRGEYHGTAIQAAAVKGHRMIVKLLLDKGADIDAQEKNASALQSASAEGHLAMVKLLLENGADINAQGKYCGSALQTASAGGYQAIVDLLLNKGAEVNVQGGRYGSALIAASSSGHTTIVESLLRNGADVNAQYGGRYSSALKAASARGYQAIVEILLRKGADAYAK